MGEKVNPQKEDGSNTLLNCTRNNRNKPRLPINPHGNQNNLPSKK
jgi:hypothetical protein